MSSDEQTEKDVYKLFIGIEPPSKLLAFIDEHYPYCGQVLCQTSLARFRPYKHPSTNNFKTPNLALSILPSDLAENE